MSPVNEIDVSVCGANGFVCSYVVFIPPETELQCI